MKYCTHCGYQLNDDDIYCSVCGSMQSASTPSAPTVYYDRVSRAVYPAPLPPQLLDAGLNSSLLPPPAPRESTHPAYPSSQPRHQPQMTPYATFGSPLPRPVHDREGLSMQIWIIGGLIMAFLCAVLGVVILLDTDRPTQSVTEDVETETIIQEDASADKNKNDYSNDPQLITVDPYPSSRRD